MRTNNSRQKKLKSTQEKFIEMKDHIHVQIVIKHSKEIHIWKAISYCIAIQSRSSVNFATPHLQQKLLCVCILISTQMRNHISVRNVNTHSGSLNIWKATYFIITPMRRRNLAMFATSLSQIWKCIWEIIAVRYIIHVKYANRDSSTSMLLWPTNKDNMEPKISNAKYASRCLNVNMTYKDIPEKIHTQRNIVKRPHKEVKNKDFKCELCHKVFGYNSSLQNHFKRIHTQRNIWNILSPWCIHTQPVLIWS